MAFKALLVEKEGSVALRDVTDEELPDGSVTVSVSHSTLNYKDGLCLQPGNGLVRNYPHVPGIDFAGSVEKSTHPRFQPGDAVILTGWGVGERHWGGFSEKARVDGDWLVPLPSNLTARHAMAIGTAGLAAMLAVIALEDHGLAPAQGEVLVTGATGGVGSIAILLLARRGYQVAAVTGKPDAHRYLSDLGAHRIIPRDDLTGGTAKPLESATWAGCVDSVGGSTLARVLSQIQYGASAAAVGLAGGSELRTTVLPFLLRGINLLGIDSVMQPYQKRVEAWQRLGAELSSKDLDALTTTARLEDLPRLGREILAGQMRGRTVIEVADTSPSASA